MTNPNERVLVLTDIHMRDPYLICVPDGTYRLYGTTDANPWEGPGRGFDVYRSEDLRVWTGPFQVFAPDHDFRGATQFWAPEVYLWKSVWYMLATFADQSGHRGTHVLSSDSPDGPFRPVSPTPVTPDEWMCLDGTLFLDNQGAPWLVFCHEWLQVVDGEIWAQQLNDDLTESVGEPTLLFRASQAPWTSPIPSEKGGRTAFVTDGPFLHRTPMGLVMIWSSRTSKGYAVGVARSETGSIVGPWTHDPEPLWDLDGGHAMIARTRTGSLLLVLHAPNNSPLERPRILPLRIEGERFSVDTTAAHELEVTSAT